MMLLLLLKHKLLGGDSLPALLSSSVNSERTSLLLGLSRVMEKLLAPRGDCVPPWLRCQISEEVDAGFEVSHGPSQDGPPAAQDSFYSLEQHAIEHYL